VGRRRAGWHKTGTVVPALRVPRSCIRNRTATLFAPLPRRNVVCMNATSTATAPARSPLLNQGQVAGLLGVCRQTVRRYTLTDPTFPSPARFGVKTLRWKHEDVERWIADRQRPATSSRRVPVVRR